MSDKEMAILKTFQKVIPCLSELEKEKLLSFGEGMAFKAEQQNRENHVQQFPTLCRLLLVQHIKNYYNIIKK